MDSNFTENMLNNCYRAAQEMERRILEGEVIEDVIYEADGSRILVTRISDTKYGYAVFEDGSDEPCYFLESNYLIDDLQKSTDYDGHPLSYLSAKSMIEKNMIGIFFEYTRYPEFHDFLASVKVPIESPIVLKQAMAGYSSQYPVTLLEANFITGEFSYAAEADVIQNKETGELQIAYGTGFLKPDGTFDFDRAVSNELESQPDPLFSRDMPLTEEEARANVEERITNAQMLLKPIYTQVGLPLPEGIEYIPLMDIALAGGDIRGYISGEGKLLAAGSSDEKGMVI